LGNDPSVFLKAGVMEPSHFGMRIADLGLQGKNERRTVNTQRVVAQILLLIRDNLVQYPLRYSL